MYLVDVDDGDNLDRFLADDPLRALSGVLLKNGRDEFSPCVVRVERLRQEGDGAKGKKV